LFLNFSCFFEIGILASFFYLAGNFSKKTEVEKSHKILVSIV